MRIKLLKKIRKQFTLEERNKEYRFYDVNSKSYTIWYKSLERVLEIRRNSILRYLSKSHYKTGKKVLKGL